MQRLWFGVALLLPASELEAANFLVMSAPRLSKISYVKVPDNGHLTTDILPLVLIDRGLRHPQGIAVDQKRKKLFVADPDMQKIYAYSLLVTEETLGTDGQQFIVAQNSESRWVAVDGVGNVFFSNEAQSQILKVAATRVLRGDPSAEVVYDGAGVSQVSRPGGVAVDNFHVFWTNKLSGNQVGSLVKGAEIPETLSNGVAITLSVSVLAKNVARSYGVCTALDNIFYTDADKYLYGVKKSGGAIASISGKFKQPRGCVWDGDGTVYVADKGDGAVYSFAGNMHSLAPVQITKVLQFEDAFGLAMVSGSTSFSRMLATLPFLATSLMVLRFVY